MRPFRIFTIAIVSLLAFFLPIQPSGSCIDYPEGEDIRFSAFQPDLGRAAGLDAFYFSADLFNESEEDNHFWYIREGLTTCDERTNTEEWMSYCGNNISAAAIDSVLYQTPPDDFFHTARKYQVNDPLADPHVYNNRFIEYLIKKNKDALEYMLYAKKCEHYRTGKDPWTDDYLYEPGLWEKLNSEGNRNYLAVHDTFLKVRYAYQLVRLGGVPSYVIDTYDSLMEPLNSESTIKYWALSFKANALHQEGKHGKANYLLSKVFEHVLDKNRRALSGFDRKYLNDALKLARNKHEKAILLVMNELRNPGRALRNIKKIRKLDPKGKEVEMLMVREVNKVEDWLLTPAIMNEDPAAGHNPTTRKYDKDYNLVYSWVNRDADKRYLEELRQYVTGVASEGNVHTPALWHVAAAYLGMMNGKADAAMQQLELAGKAKGKTMRLETQIRITRALVAASNLKSDSTAQAGIRQDLLWLDEHWKLMYRPMRTMQHFTLALSEKYLAAGDTVTAALLRYKTTDYSVRRDAWDGYFDESFRFLDEKGSPRIMDKLVARVGSKNKSKFERYITREAVADLDRLHDLQGTWHLRYDRLEEALAAFCKAPDSLWNSYPYQTYLDVNPFHVDLNNPHRRNEEDSTGYTKPQMIERLIRLKEEAAKGGPDAAEKYRLIANAYYSMTWHGNSWIMTRPGWSMSDPEGDWWMRSYRTPYIEEFYYGCTRAKKYYLEAMKRSEDPEQAALCCLMAAVCDRNYVNYVTKNNEKAEDRYSKYFVLLNNRYATTRFYDRLLDECPGIKKYIAKYN